MSRPRSSQADARPRSGRGRPPKGAPLLSRASIVGAALAQIEADGLTGVSMRSVARRLGVDAKSLYNHVDGKEGLLDAVADHILATMVLPEPTGDLAVDIRAIAYAFRDHALSQPRATSLVLTRQTASVASLAPIESVMAVLADAGIEHAGAVHLLRTFLATLIGMVLREADAGPTFGADNPDAIDRRRTLLADSRLPHVSAAAGHLARFDKDEEFAYAVELLVGAISREHSSNKSPPTRRRSPPRSKPSSRH